MDRGELPLLGSGPYAAAYCLTHFQGDVALAESGRLDMVVNLPPGAVAETVRNAR